MRGGRVLLRLRGVRIAPLVSVDLEVTAGESLAIVAGEGGGKSRLARVMAGLLVPEAGQVEWLGAARGIGFVFRVPELRFLCATPWEEVALTPADLGWTGEALRLRVEDSLGWAGVASGLWHREWAWLSAAERYRVGLASVHAAQPQLMLLDEPGAMLSDTGEEGVAFGVRQLAAQHGVATVIFTSRPDRARRFAAQVISFNH